MTEVSQEGE